MMNSISTGRLIAVIATIAVLCAPRDATAHFVWLDAVGDEQPRAALFFSEGPEERDYHLPEAIAAAEIYVRTADGKRTKATLNETDSDEFIGLKSVETIATPCTIETTCQYGVYHGTLLTYYAKHIAAGPSGAGELLQPAKDQTLDIVPQLGPKEAACTVYWQGKPAANATVTIIRATGERSEVETNDKGVASFRPIEEKGLVAFLAGRPDPDASGEIDGETYASGTNYASVTMHYDPATARPADEDRAQTTNVPFPLLPEAIASFGAAVADGWLYVYSGHTGTAHDHSRENLSQHFCRLNLSDGESWEELPMQTTLQGLALAAHDGVLYRVGGVHSRNAADDEADMHSTDAFAKFNPASKMWTDLPNLPAPRSSHDAIVLDDKLYVVGGWALAGEGDGEWQESALAYDLSAGADGSWKELPKPPFVRRALATAAYDGRLWAIGGLDDYGDVMNSVFVFDPQTGEWSNGPELSGEGMRGFGVAAWGAETGLYVSPASGKVYRLDDDQQGWSEIDSLDVPRFFHRLLPGPDGSLLAIAGASMGDGHVAAIEVVSLDQ